MQLFTPSENPKETLLPLVSSRIAAGFPSPATDYIETRIDLNQELIKNPSFTFYAFAEGDSMEPEIRNGDLLIVDRKVPTPNGCVVLASVNKEFCVKRLHRYPDGSLELRSDNPKYKPINLSCEFEGEFEIFGRVIKAVHDLQK